MFLKKYHVSKKYEINLCYGLQITNIVSFNRNIICLNNTFYVFSNQRFASLYNIISCHHNFLLAHFVKILKVVNLIVDERSTWKCSRPMHRAVENNTPIALREQRTSKITTVTLLERQVAHIFPRGAVRRPFFAVVEHRVARTSWISGCNSAGYSTLDT